jgi:hypothetical protein
MKDFKFDFQIGKRKKTIKEWVIYSVVLVGGVSILIGFINTLLQNKFGKATINIICNTQVYIPDQQVRRFIFAFCTAVGDGKIDEDEATGIIDRGQQLLRNEEINDFFVQDEKVINQRVKNEVDYAINEYTRQTEKPRFPCSEYEQFPSDGSSAQQLLGGTQEIRFVGPLGECNLNEVKDVNTKEIYSLPRPKESDTTGS